MGKFDIYVKVNISRHYLLYLVSIHIIYMSLLLCVVLSDYRWG